MRLQLLEPSSDSIAIGSTGNGFIGSNALPLQQRCASMLSWYIVLGFIFLRVLIIIGNLPQYQPRIEFDTEMQPSLLPPESANLASRQREGVATLGTKRERSFDVAENSGLQAKVGQLERIPVHNPLLILP